jgi:hypothetical protein
VLGDDLVDRRIEADESAAQRGRLDLEGQDQIVHERGPSAEK